MMYCVFADDTVADAVVIAVALAGYVAVYDECGEYASTYVDVADGVAVHVDVAVAVYVVVVVDDVFVVCDDVAIVVVAVHADVAFRC